MGCVLIVAGVVMLMTPGPGLLALAAGVALLGRHNRWTRRLGRSTGEWARRVGAATRSKVGPRHRDQLEQDLSAKIRVVGLLGAGRIPALVSAGHDVALDPTVEFARLDGCDLLLVALAPPEPPPAAFLHVLRERSSIPVLVLEPGLTAAEERLLFAFGAARCEDAGCSDAQLLADIDGMLTHHRDRPNHSSERSSAEAPSPRTDESGSFGGRRRGWGPSRVAS